MKKALTLIVAGITALVLGGCGSTTPAVAGDSAGPAVLLGNVPQFVNDAYMNASEDVIIGIGVYKIGSDVSKTDTGMTFAQARARADITRQLTSIIKNMINDYTTTSEIDPDSVVSFQENITNILARAELRGARVVQSQTDNNGLLWVVMEYSKSAAANDYSAATAAARLAVPAAAAFDALTRMDTAFNKAAAGGPIPVDD